MAQQFVMMISMPNTAMHITLLCSIMHYTRPRYFTLGTSWIYRPRLSSPIFGVALRIILTRTAFVTCSSQHAREEIGDTLCAMPFEVVDQVQSGHLIFWLSYAVSWVNAGIEQQELMLVHAYD